MEKTARLPENRVPKIFGIRLLESWNKLTPQQTFDDLKVPPGNCLEVLSGNRDGQYSIRINDQYRVCFEWDSGNAENVEIVDYH